MNEEKILLEDTFRLFKELKASADPINASLRFAKFFSPNQKGVKIKYTNKGVKTVEYDYKCDELNAICKNHNDSITKNQMYIKKANDNLRAYLETNFNDDCAEQIIMRTTANLAINLSQGSVAENAAISFYIPYGFAYIPGSSVKGICRSYAENNGIDKKTIKEIFGDDSEDGSKSSGKVVFYDALPYDDFDNVPQPMQLHVDISNVHHKNYYDGDSKYDLAYDTENPNPVSFLALMPGACFNFYLSLREGLTDGELLAKARQILINAICNNGIGAKTSLGYGKFDPEGETVELPKDQNKIDFILKLITPAFLAGQDPKNIETCVLRPSTLKGVLRWWWRTMYSTQLKRDELAKRISPALQGEKLYTLERLIWGGIAGKDVNRSPLQINIENVQYDEKKISIKLKEYSAFGMFSMKNDDNQFDRYLSAVGNKWNVSFVFSDSIGTVKNRKIKIDKELIREEVEKSLYLLYWFGGLGAKSRNGFGSVKLLSAKEKNKSFSFKYIAKTPTAEIKKFSFKYEEPKDENLKKYKDFLYAKAALKIISDFKRFLSCLLIALPTNENHKIPVKHGRQKELGFADADKRMASPLIFSVKQNNTIYIRVFKNSDNLGNNNIQGTTIQAIDSLCYALTKGNEKDENFISALVENCRKDDLDHRDLEELKLRLEQIINPDKDITKKYIKRDGEYSAPVLKQKG